MKFTADEIAAVIMLRSSVCHTWHNRIGHFSNKISVFLLLFKCFVVSMAFVVSIEWVGVCAQYVRR